MNRICFLDIDGVLNSRFWNDSHQREIRASKKFSLVKAAEILAWLEMRM